MLFFLHHNAERKKKNTTLIDMYRILVMVVVVVVNFQNLNVNVHHHHHHRLSILYIVRNDDLPTSTREWRNHQTEKKTKWIHVQNAIRMCVCVCTPQFLLFFRETFIYKKKLAIWMLPFG